MKSVPGYPRFQIDDNLNIYRDGAKVVCNTPEQGYAFIADGYGGVVKRATIICSAFHGPKPFASAEVAHYDGNPGNDNPLNLRWDTHSNNMKDVNRYNPGWRTGEKNGRCILSDRDVDSIFDWYAKGLTQKKIADIYGVGQSQISRILRGEQRGIC